MVPVPARGASRFRDALETAKLTVGAAARKMRSLVAVSGV